MKSTKEKNIIYKELKLKNRLSIFVKSFWCFENNENKIQNYSILSDGCFDLLIYFKKNSKKEINLTGLWNKNIEVSIPAKTKILAIRFKPISAEYIIGKSISDLLNSMIKISSKDFNLLKQFNTDYQEFDSFVTSNIIKLQSTLETEKGIDSRKEKVFELLFKSKGNISVKEISERAYWSNRQISRYFNENYGLSVKEYANILRVNSTYKDLAKGKHYPQTEYYDQSHFIKEIKKHTGVNPKILIKNKNDRFLQLSTNQMK
ncbi:MAG: helix-turn-helix domain-containing protein [Melioribacteraceae bacterium]|nr:helix-turn-helix domain-containing protein [Melioribacteraceae bacterium]